MDEQKKDDKELQERIPCTMCKRTLKNNIYLQLHMLRHSLERTHKCQFCNKRYVYPNQLQRHLKIHTREYKCWTCFLSFTTKESLEAHVICHSNETYQCKLCDLYFQTRKIQKKHLLLHRGMETRKIVGHTSTCSEEVNIQDQISQPPKPFAPENPFADGKPMGYKCWVCSEMFEKREQAIEHMISYHPEQRKCHCSGCKESISADEILAQSNHGQMNLTGLESGDSAIKITSVTSQGEMLLNFRRNLELALDRKSSTSSVSKGSRYEKNNVIDDEPKVIVVEDTMKPGAGSNADTWIINNINHFTDHQNKENVIGGTIRSGEASYGDVIIHNNSTYSFLEDQREFIVLGDTMTSGKRSCSDMCINNNTNGFIDDQSKVMAIGDPTASEEGSCGDICNNDQPELIHIDDTMMSEGEANNERPTFGNNSTNGFINDQPEIIVIDDSMTSREGSSDDTCINNNTNGFIDVSPELIVMGDTVKSRQGSNIDTFINHNTSGLVNNQSEFTLIGETMVCGKEFSCNLLINNNTNGPTEDRSEIMDLDDTRTSGEGSTCGININTNRFIKDQPEIIVIDDPSTSAKVSSADFHNFHPRDNNTNGFIDHQNAVNVICYNKTPSRSTESNTDSMILQGIPLGENSIENNIDYEFNNDNGSSCLLIGSPFHESSFDEYNGLAFDESEKHFSQSHHGSCVEVPSGSPCPIELSSDNLFLCHTCAQMFAEESELNLHMHLHTKDECEKYSCPSAHVSFLKTPSTSPRPIEFLSNYLFLCQTCAQMFAEESELILHMHLHTKQETDLDDQELMLL